MQTSLQASDWERARPLFLRWKADPAAFVIEAFGVEPEPWQIEVMRALGEHDRVAVRSGHGVGKSAMQAWVILWWLFTHFPAKVACTAPTAHQLEDVLWGEVAKWARRLHPWLADQIEVKADRIELKTAPNESFAVARTARKEQPEAFQGFHSDNMLFVGDEASGIEDIIFEVGEGAMSTAGAKTLLAGNPTRTSGYFYDVFHRMRSRWRTFKVGCADSSRVSPSYIEDMALKYGRDSNIYRVRVLGEFPQSEDDTVIPLHLCEAAMHRQIAPVRSFRPIWGLDVARFGDDRTALCKRQGNVIVEPIKWWRGKDTMQVAGLVYQEYRDADEDERPSAVLVDVIGLGAGVVDRLRELGVPVRGINVGEAAAVSDRYMRLRDELWFKGREWLAAADCKLPQDEALIAELTGPKYAITSSGKIKVEAKDDMKKRGLQSPDLADAFILTLAGGMERRPDGELDRYRRPARRGGGRSWMTV